MATLTPPEGLGTAQRPQHDAFSVGWANLAECKQNRPVLQLQLNYPLQSRTINQCVLCKQRRGQNRPSAVDYTASNIYVCGLTSAPWAGQVMRGAARLHAPGLGSRWWKFQSQARCSASSDTKRKGKWVVWDRIFALFIQKRHTFSVLCFQNIRGGAKLPEAG